MCDNCETLRDLFNPHNNFKPTNAGLRDNLPRCLKAVENKKFSRKQQLIPGHNHWEQKSIKMAADFFTPDLPQALVPKPLLALKDHVTILEYRHTNILAIKLPIVFALLVSNRSAVHAEHLVLVCRQRFYRLQQMRLIVIHYGKRLINLVYVSE